MAQDKKPEELEQEDKKPEELVEIKHFAKDGVMIIDGTPYDIVKGKVKVAPEHLNRALKHISMGG